MDKNIYNKKKIDNLIISYSDNFGGAAKAALRINECLKNSNISSKMLVVKKITNFKNITNPIGLLAKLNFKIKNKILLVLKNIIKSDKDRSFNIFNSPILNEINYLMPKLVNINWIGAETISIKDISKIKSQILFTLHDMWSFCGSEHYVDANKEHSWKNGYKKKNSLLLNLDYYIWKMKVKYWKNFSVIAPSKWIYNLAKKSYLMRNKKIYYIPYPINTNLYCHEKKKNFYNKKVNLLFSAFGNVDNPRKGIQLLIRILDKLDPNSFNLNIIGFGADKYLKNKKYNINFYHLIKDEKKLIKIYNKSDICLITSLVDNYPLVLMEAQSCGLPCIGFDAGGIKESILNNKTGFVIKNFNINKYVKKINYLIANRHIIKKFSINSRRFAVLRWSYPIIAKKYNNLFKKII